MIKIRDIERVYEIIDRELAHIEISRTSERRKFYATRDWMYVREQFRQLCLQVAKQEGLIGDTQTSHLSQ